MIKIFEYQHPDWGIVFKKISKAFKDYFPEEFIWVSSIEESDIQLVHVVGAGEVEIIQKSPLPIIWQHTYKTSGVTNWKPFWEKALLVISFYDFSDQIKSFYHSPLGFEESIYNKTIDFNSRYNIAFVTGHVINTENIDIVHKACVKTNFTLLHTGEDFSHLFSTNYIYMKYMPEKLLAETFNQCKVIFGLRDLEGFELHALEGAACGAVPIVPTINCYDWYDGIAKRVDVEDKQVLEEQLVDFLNTVKADPTISAIINREKLKLFTWKNVITKISNVIKATLWQF